MKHKIIFTTIIASLLLSSCSLFKTYSTKTQDLDVYLLETAIKKEDYANAKVASVSAEFIDGEKYIPYITLEQYASLYEPYLIDGAKSKVDYEGSTATWTIYVGSQLYFASIFYGSYGQVLVGGNISNAIDNEIFGRDIKALSYNTNFSGEAIPLGGSNGFATYDFDTTEFKHFRKNNKTYYPLGFFDTTYSASSGIYHFYNYKNIYVTQDADNFSKEFKNDQGQLTSSDKEMQAITNGESIPQYLIDYNANLFVYMMENFYGLKSNYEILSLKSYYKNKGLYNNLFTTSNVDRGNAYSSCLACFDDNHTVFVSANSAWGEENTQRYGGERMIKRSALKAKLLELKQNTLKTYFSNDEYDYEKGEYEDYMLSTSKKTAMFYFDSFKFGSSEEVFNNDGSIKEGVEQYDTYFNFLSRLNTLKDNSDINNIIIDASTNGGGVIGVMGRLLALLSKNNSSELTMYDESTSVVSINYLKVDVNNDKKYTDDETFGNRFNFYILTSDFSFSCGNAFPCYAQRMGIKTIGENSGGGECAVNIHYMPNSEYIYHSSRNHIGAYDKENKKFIGFEPGAKPDYSLVPTGHNALLEPDGKGGYIDNIPNNFYDINYLESVISAK